MTMARGTSTPVSFSWQLRPSGRAEIFLSVPEEDANRTNRYAVILHCDARFESFEAETLVPYVVREFNGDGDCDGSYSDRSAQVVYVGVDSSGSASVRGVPRGQWTASAGGQRTARTPHLRLGTRPPEITGFDSSDLREPDARSSVAATLWGSASESLQSYLPVELSPGRVDINAYELSLGEPGDATGSVVSWGREYSESPRVEGQPSGLLPGTARWADARGTADAQRSLLLSGVLLGVVASLVVEGAFALVRARGAPPAAT